MVELRPDWSAIADCVDAYELSRQQDSSVGLEAFLDGVDEQARPDALVELVCCDLDFTWRELKPRFVEEYLNQYPLLTCGHAASAGAQKSAQVLSDPEVAGRIRRLLLAEIEVRHACGEHVERSELESRFPTLADSVLDVLNGKTQDIGDNAGSSSEGNAGTASDDTTDSSEQTQIVRGHGTALTLLSSGAEPCEFPVSFGRYRIDARLGSGAMGTVWLARDQTLDRQVALKIPKPDALRESTDRDRFFREARAAAGIRHSAVCPVYDAGCFEGVCYLAMAWIDGRSLDDIVSDGDGLDIHEAVRLIARLAPGLQSAHDQNVIHRDVKPANIMVDVNGQPLLTDFGLARRDVENEAELTHFGSLVGTPAYMAPELFSGRREQTTAASDQYSLGVVLFRLLTGTLPFRGSIVEIASRAGTEAPPRPSDLVEGLPCELEQIVLKAMARDPEDRFPSVAELGYALDQWLQKTAADSQWAATSRQELPVFDGRTGHEEPADGMSRPRQTGSEPVCETSRGVRTRTRRRTAFVCAGAVLIAAVLAVAEFGPGVFTRPGTQRGEQNSPRIVQRDQNHGTQLSAASRVGAAGGLNEQFFRPAAAESAHGPDADDRSDGRSDDRPSADSVSQKDDSSSQEAASLTVSEVAALSHEDAAHAAVATADDDRTPTTGLLTQSGGVEPTPETPKRPAGRTDLARLSMRLRYQRVNEVPRLTRVLDGAGVILNVGDYVRIEGTLPPDTYAYLFWYDARGRPVLLWPKDADADGQTITPAVYSPELDATGVNQQWWPIEGEPGFDVVILACTQNPLTTEEIDAWTRQRSELAFVPAELKRGLGRQKVISADRPIISEEFRRRLQGRFDQFTARVVGIDRPDE